MKPIFQKSFQFGDIWPRNCQILASYPNYVTWKWLIHFSFFWFSFLKLVFNYHFDMNVTRSNQKLLFPRFLTLKMVPKPFQNYPKIEVLGQFFKNSCKGFPHFRRSSQCILVGLCNVSQRTFFEYNNSKLFPVLNMNIILWIK